MLRVRILLLLALTVSLGAFVNADIYNPCDSFDDFTAAEGGVVVGGGPDGDDCINFVTRVTNDHLLTWSVTGIVNPGDTLTFDAKNALALGTAYMDVRVYYNAVATPYSPNITGLAGGHTFDTDEWVECSIPMPPQIENCEIDYITFSVAENTKVISLDNLLITQNVPEPATMSLIASGIAFVMLRKRK